MTQTPIPVTAIVLTYNEAANMAPCLSAITEIDDIVVLDSCSTDATAAEAKRIRPDVRIYEHPFKDFGDQRNWALDNCAPRHSWVLFVDADEYCTPEFVAELRAFVANPGGCVGAFVAGRNYFLGQWLKRTTMFPSYQLRLLRLGEVHFRKSGHGQSEVTNGPLRYFREGWIHNGFSKGVSQWIGRHNVYSSEEVAYLAELRRERISIARLLKGSPRERRQAMKALSARAPLRPLMRFFYIYVLRGGFLDGCAGLNYCLLRLSHDLHISVKVREQRYLGTSCEEARGLR